MKPASPYDTPLVRPVNDLGPMHGGMRGYQPAPKHFMRRDAALRLDAGDRLRRDRVRGRPD